MQESHIHQKPEEKSSDVCILRGECTLAQTTAELCRLLKGRGEIDKLKTSSAIGCPQSVSLDFASRRMCTTAILHALQSYRSKHQGLWQGLCVIANMVQLTSTSVPFLWRACQLSSARRDTLACSCSALAWRRMDSHRLSILGAFRLQYSCRVTV